MRFSRRILSLICVAAACCTVNGCGSGGGSTGQATVSTASSPATRINSYAISEDQLGLKSADFMAGTNENGVFALRVAIADSVNDPNFVDIFRIDILKPTQITATGTYSVGENEDPAIMPCNILFFNGEKSSLLKTVTGTVSFTSYGANTGDLVAGTFAVQVEDDGVSPKLIKKICGSFTFVVNMPGSIN